MRNLVLLTGHLASGATATATATAAGYDPANALALDRSGSSWLGVGTGTQQLVFHTPTSIVPTGLGIAGGNYSKWGTTKLGHSPDGTTWTDFLTLTGLPAVDTDQDYFAKLTAAPSKPWWRLQFAGASAAPEVGNFYLGTYAELSKNDSYPAVKESVYSVETDDSEGRVTVQEPTARMLARWRLNWARVTSSVRDEIQTPIDVEAALGRPFYFVPIDESGTSVVGRAYFVRYEPSLLTVTRSFLNEYAVGATLVEQV